MGARSLGIIMGGLPFALQVVYSAQDPLENLYMHLPCMYLLPILTSLYASVLIPSTPFLDVAQLPPKSRCCPESDSKLILETIY